jgi:TatD DNase family protein
MKSSGVSRCVVNATQEADWAVVENLADTEPGFVFPAFGIHPWHAHTATSGWQEKLRFLLEKHPQASIGECGLDTWISQPPLEIQRPIFLDQLRLARELDRPLTVHCLKAWGPLFEAFSERLLRRLHRDRASTDPAGRLFFDFRSLPPSSEIRRA